MAERVVHVHLDVGSSPTVATKILGAWCNWLAHHPVKVKACGFESRRSRKNKWGRSLMVERLTVDQLGESSNLFGPAKWRSGGMVDTLDLKSSGCKVVWVRLPPSLQMGMILLTMWRANSFYTFVR